MQVKHIKHLTHILAKLGETDMSLVAVSPSNDVSISGFTDAEILTAESKLDLVTLAMDIFNQPIKDSITALEKSVDNARTRRNYSEGMRKRFEGFPQEPDETLAIEKVTAVNDSIIALRATMKR